MRYTLLFIILLLFLSACATVEKTPVAAAQRDAGGRVITATTEAAQRSRSKTNSRINLCGLWLLVF